MTKFWAISKNTFTQTIRQSIYGVVILVTFMVLLLNLTLAGWTMGTNYRASDQKMLESLGLSSLLVSGLLVAAFSASSVLSREIEDKTALTVISKPVWRGTFVLGKFAGVSAAVVVAFYLCCLAFFMTVRHGVMSSVSDPYDVPVIVFGAGSIALSMLTAVAGNLLFGWNFVSSAVWAGAILMSVAMGLIGFIGKHWEIVAFGSEIGGQLPVATILLLMAVMIFSAVAVAAGTRLGQVLTLLVCIAVFFVGSMHPFLFGQWAADVPAARVLGYLAPNLPNFYKLDELMLEKPIPPAYLLWVGGYAACYIAAVLAVAVALFQRRQIDIETSSAAMPPAVGVMAFAGRAAAVAAAVGALVAVSLPSLTVTAKLGIAGGLMVLAIVLWLLWGCFGRGAKWSYWAVLAIAVVLLVRAVAMMLTADALQFMAVEGSATLFGGEAVVAAAMLIVLAFRRTRYHFQTVNS